MLSKVEAVNFQSWSNLKFDISKGVTLIDGINVDDGTSEGSGKSAVINAVAWCIYGKIPKDAKIDDVIKHGETSCLARVSFSSGDSIVRSRKPNDLFIKKSDGKVVKGKDAKETQELVEEYIGDSFETFCQSTYFAQNYDKKFLTSNQEDKGKILSSIQNLSIFDKARREVMELSKLEVENHEKFLHQIQLETNNLRSLQTQQELVMSFIKEKVRNHKDQETKIQTQITSLWESLGSVTSTAQNTKDALDQINIEAIDKDIQDLGQVKNEYSNVLAKLSYEKSQIDSVKRTLLLKESEGLSLTNKYNNLQNKKSYDVAQNHPTYLQLVTQKKRHMDFNSSPSYTRLEKKRTDLEAYIKNPTKTCPSCGSDLKNIDLSHTQQELSSVLSEMEQMARISAASIEQVDKDILSFEIQFQKDVETLEQESKSILAQLTEIANFLDQNKAPNAEEITAKENETRTLIKQIDSTIQDLQTKKMGYSKLQSDYSHHLFQMNQFTKMIEEQSQILKAHGTPNIANEELKIQAINQSISSAQDNIKSTELLDSKCVEYSGRLDQLKDGFREIKSYVFNNALSELNYRANQYLTQLFEVDATLKFTTEDQKIETRIILDGRETSLGLLSGGQHRRFNLAVDLALSDIVANRKTSKLNILILYEYFKDLSETSMEKCLDLLKSRKSPVLIIEHNTIFKNIVDNTFFVKLEDGTSHESRQ